MIEKYDVLSDEGTVIRRIPDAEADYVALVSRPNAEADYVALVSRPNAEADYVALVSRGQVVGLWQSDLFVDTLKERFGKVVCVADEVISSLKRNLDYSGYYTAFLLDQLSEEEFQKISEDYSISLQANETDETKEKFRILFGISKEKFTSADLSNIFKIEEAVAEGIINNLKEKGIIEKSGNY